MKKCELLDGTVIEYDETTPCLICGNPIINLSMSGVLCPSCDCGHWRDGRQFDLHRDFIWIIKGYEHLKPPVPTFQEVNDVAVALAAHGIRVVAWELACTVHLGEA